MPSDLQITNIKDQANANSAITIASDGQITVNQNNPTLTLGSNTTLSSTVSLANATFPAGHVIQTFTDTHTVTGPISITSSDDYLGSDLQVTITPKATGNKLFIQAFIHGVYNEGGSIGVYMPGSLMMRILVQEMGQQSGLEQLLQITITI